MKIYTITLESNIYQSLVPDDPAIWETNAIKFDGASKLEHWTQPSFRVYNPKLKQGDFVGIGPGCLGIRSRAQKDLLEWLERSGEFLQIIPESLDVSIFNVTECCDCLDHDRVQWVYGEKSGKPIRIEKYAFTKNLIPESTIFKIPEFAKSEILVHDGFGDLEDTFIYAVKEHGLKGIRFDEIWCEN